MNGIESTELRASIQAVCLVHFAPEDFIRTLAYSFDQHTSTAPSEATEAC